MTTLAPLELRISAIEVTSGMAILLGNRRWLVSAGQDCSMFPASEDAAETLIAWGGRGRAQFLFAEELRTGLSSTLESLRQADIRLLMLTGDRAPRPTGSK